MKHWLLYLVAIIGIIGMESCENTDEPRFSPKTAPICPSDSAAYMDLFQSLNLRFNANPNLILNKWRFATFEYDDVTKYRYIVRIEVYREFNEPEADSISSSIGRMKHLRYLSLRNLRFRNNTTLPGEVFHCPLDTFICTTNIPKVQGIQGIIGKLPPDVRMAKNTLKYLSIEFTSLSELCEELAELTLLEECRLAHNMLSGKIPDYIGDMTGKIDLSYNRYTEYDWRQIAMGKNIPDACENYIHNKIPPELEWITFYPEIMENFYNQRPL